MLTRPERSRALVLGGGGVTGIAWMTGLLFGLEEGGVDLATDIVIGTSAGAAVGAQLTSGASLAVLYERQANPARQPGELTPRIRYFALMRRVVPALLVRRDKALFRQRIGRMAQVTKTVDRTARRDVIADRLPTHVWPSTPLVVAAIDASSGELRWFDKDSGVGLVDAVAASCAVPGVWPPVLIGERLYYDGGIPSPDNADRATGFERVLVVSPLGSSRSGSLSKRLSAEVAMLEEGGSHVTVVTPDKAARTAMGVRPLDPTRRTASAEAGLEQGRDVVAALARDRS